MSERNISCIYITCILISGIKLSSSKRGDCRSKDFAFDVLMMPYDHDVGHAEWNVVSQRL